MLANRQGPENHGDPPLPACPQEAVRSGLPVDRWGPGGLMIAVSGGPDSVALAHAVIEIARSAGKAGSPMAAGPRLFLAHVNHQLRGADSDADEQLVSRLASQWGAEFASAVAPSGGPFAGLPREGLLRRLRYQALARLAADRGVRLVLTAHHTDDLAETVLFRLMRGTGLRGLRGIPFSRPLADGISLVRPLLGIGKADLLAYAVAQRLEFRRDRSNDDSGPARNWVRHQVVPLLRQRFGRAVPLRLGELAREARDVVALLDDEAHRLLEQCAPERHADLVRIVLKPLRAARPLVVQALLHLLWSQQGWPLGPMDRERWTELARLLVRADGDARLELPGKVSVQVSRDGSATFLGPAPSGD
jgi:tRNA(Ile)-lysidine synthase